MSPSPCSRCGDVPVLHLTNFIGGGGGYWLLSKCGRMIPRPAAETEVEAVSAWNERNEQIRQIYLSTGQCSAEGQSK